MKQAQQMQQRLQQQMTELRVEGNAGGGMVTVVVNGAKQVQSLKIDPEVVSKDERNRIPRTPSSRASETPRKSSTTWSSRRPRRSTSRAIG